MRESFEAALGRWGFWVAGHAGWVIAAVLLATGLLATQLQHFRLDTSLESYFHEDDPVRIQYDAFRDLFGRDTMIAIALVPEGGVFDASFLESLRSIHEAIEDEVPLIAEVTSLVNIRETRGSADELEVGDFLADWPETDAEFADAKDRALANPLYRNLVVSEDATVAVIGIEIEAYSDQVEDALSGFESDADDANASGDGQRTLTTGEDDDRITRAIEEILERHALDNVEVHLAGMPSFNAILAREISRDMAVFTGLSVLLVAFFLAVLFRRLAAVLLPLATVLLSVVATLSVMSAARTPLMPPTQIIPSFLLAVGIGGAVHLLTIFYQARRNGEAKPEAIAVSLSHSGLPIVMTSLTTAGGLVSFSSAALRPISHFGWITPIGVLFALFFVLTLLPALIAVVPMRPTAGREEDTASQRALIEVGAYSTRNARTVLGIWAVVLIFALAGTTRLTMGHDMVKWFPESSPMRQAIEFMNEAIGGSVSLEILVDGGRENALHEPTLLERIDAVHDFAEGYEHSGVRADKTISIADVVKETHRALNENREDHYVVPDSRALVSQELLLFENSGNDDVEDLVTSQFDTARITVRMPLVDGAFYVPFMGEFEGELRELLGPEVDFRVTGGLPLLGHTVTAALASMSRSYFTAFVIITLLMIALIGNLRMGLLSMLPNLAPVVFVLGMMGWMDIHLDMLNLMLGSIVIGLAVDDTIHFMHSFRREIERTGRIEEAVALTLRSTGQALFFTSCVLVGGFLVYTQAFMVNLWHFGVLIAIAIFVAFLADVTLAPALVSRVSWEQRAKS